MYSWVGGKRIPWYIPVFIGVWLAVMPLRAQESVSVNVQLPFAGQMPARIDEWRENESLIRLVVQNAAQVDYGNLPPCSIQISRDGRIALLEHAMDTPPSPICE